MIKTLVNANDITSRLAALGLSESMLAETIRRGYVAFASCTPNDPPLFPGFKMWATIVRALRELLFPDWSRSDDNNYSLVINPAGTVAIAVATGDDATGRPDTVPTTKSSKGPHTVAAVTSNHLQFEFPYNELPIPTLRARPDEQRMTWILLVHRAPTEVRCELSLPTSIGSDGHVDGWRERIILTPLSTDPEDVEIAPPHPALPDITVEVKRRA